VTVNLSVRPPKVSSDEQRKCSERPTIVDVRDSCGERNDRHRSTPVQLRIAQAAKTFQGSSLRSLSPPRGCPSQHRRSCCRCTFGERAATPVSGLRSSPLIGTWAGFRRTSQNVGYRRPVRKGPLPPEGTLIAPHGECRASAPTPPALPPVRAFALRCSLVSFFARALPPRLLNS
jgi:hypothetical protein